jgi:hypothetical protein
MKLVAAKTIEIHKAGQLLDEIKMYLRGLAGYLLSSE